MGENPNPVRQPVHGEHLAALHQAIVDDQERIGGDTTGYYRWRAQRLTELAEWLRMPTPPDQMPTDRSTPAEGSEAGA